MATMLSTRDVARTLGLSENRVRALVRSGLCRPTRAGRRYAFSFQDLVVLRTAKGLIDQQVPAARVRRALLALSEALPEERPLSGLRVLADGGDVVVRDDHGSFQPETGQTVLDFSLDELRERAAVVRTTRPAAGAPDAARVLRARVDFERGLALEEVDPEGALDAYASALALDPGLVDAAVNRGRILHQAGRIEETVELYEAALATGLEDPILHFNLALALEDARGANAAASHYEQALALDPDFADAHYNLAGLCEQLGRAADALRHYHAYKKLTEG